VLANIRRGYQFHFSCNQIYVCAGPPAQFECTAGLDYLPFFQLGKKTFNLFWIIDHCVPRNMSTQSLTVHITVAAEESNELSPIFGDGLIEYSMADVLQTLVSAVVGGFLVLAGQLVLEDAHRAFIDNIKQYARREVQQDKRVELSRSGAPKALSYSSQATFKTVETFVLKAFRA
jgi:hypothetical protein